MYNPRSVVCSLTDNQISNYWTSSGPYDEIFYYIRNNVEGVRNDLVVYGLLSYEDGSVYIPNRALMDKFNELLLSNESLGYVHNLAKEPERMLKWRGELE